MIPVKIQTSPGNYTTVMRPKNNVGNPYQTRQNDPNANIPGYNEFLKLKPSATEIREFTESKGLTSPTGQAIFNAKQNGSSNPASPVVAPTATPAAQTPIQAVAENPNAGLISPTPMTINTMPSARNVQPTSAPIPTAPVRTNKPQIGTNSPATNQAQPTAQDNFPNFYTEQNDTSNFYQQQNSNPNAQQESIEQKLYMNALNNIENALKYNDRSTAETIYNKTINEFKNPKRKDLFGKQIQRVRSKYLNPA
jgi:hypothetical protein